MGSILGGCERNDREVKLMRKTKSNSIEPGGVSEYIAACPKEAQGILRKIRETIRKAAPGAVETVSYFHMPGYSYEGYDYNGMFAWFSYKKPNVRLHLRPPVVEDHGRELAGYATTKSIVSFPVEKEPSMVLVRKLVEASLKVMKGGAG